MLTSRTTMNSEMQRQMGLENAWLARTWDFLGVYLRMDRYQNGCTSSCKSNIERIVSLYECNVLMSNLFVILIRN